MAQPRIYYDNRLLDGNLVASTTTAGTHVDNLTDWRSFTWWRPTTLPATVTVDCGSARSADSLVVYGHDLFTRSGTIEVRGSTDNFAASDVLVHSYAPPSDAPFARSFTAVSYRYWRVRITGSTPTPQLAIVAIGAAFDLDGYLSLDFDPIGRSAVGRVNRNEQGQPLGRVVDYVEQQQTITMRRTTWDWLRNTFLPAWNAHLRATPFAWQWNRTIDTDVRLVVAGDQLDTPHYPERQCDVTFTVRGVV